MDTPDHNVRMDWELPVLVRSRGPAAGGPARKRG